MAKKKELTYIAYKACKFTPEKIELIKLARVIIDQYHKEGYKLTLRQLYYQFVARDVIANTERSYKNLGTLIGKARMAGIIAWDAIEDRTRFLREQPHWASPADLLRSAADQFRTRKWDTQKNYVEVWIEKDALVGILERTCNNLDVPIMSCRGYGSLSMMWESAQRFLEHEKQPCYIIHLGDHDPSGLDMSRDIEDRLYDFGICNLTLIRAALTMEQIEEYDPPPNPAKLSDSRATDYIIEHGRSSWELDALEPKVLAQVVEDHVVDLMDVDAFNGRVADDKYDRERIKTIADEWEEEDDV
jgi:hypothetical protein